MTVTDLTCRAVCDQHANSLQAARSRQVGMRCTNLTQIPTRVSPSPCVSHIQENKSTTHRTHRTHRTVVTNFWEAWLMTFTQQTAKTQAKRFRQGDAFGTSKCHLWQKITRLYIEIRVRSNILFSSRHAPYMKVPQRYDFPRSSRIFAQHSVHVSYWQSGLHTWRTLRIHDDASHVHLFTRKLPSYHAREIPENIFKIAKK